LSSDSKHIGKVITFRAGEQERDLLLLRSTDKKGFAAVSPASLSKCISSENSWNHIYKDQTGVTFKGIVIGDANGVAIVSINPLALKV